MSSKYLAEFMAKQWPTRGYMLGRVGSPGGFSSFEAISQKSSEIFKDLGLHRRPQFTHSIGRLTHILKPSTMRRNKLVDEKKQNYLEQTQFIVRYIVGQKAYEERLKEIEEI